MKRINQRRAYLCLLLLGTTITFFSNYQNQQTLKTTSFPKVKNQQGNAPENRVARARITGHTHSDHCNHQLLTPPSDSTASISQEKQPLSRISQLMEQQYFSQMPDHIKYNIIKIADLKDKEKVRIELFDSKNKRRSSYHALVSSSGQIVHTWHKPIRH